MKGIARCWDCDTEMYPVERTLDGVRLGLYSYRCPHCRDGEPAKPRPFPRDPPPSTVSRFKDKPMRLCSWLPCRKPFVPRENRETLCSNTCRLDSARSRARKAKVKASNALARLKRTPLVIPASIPHEDPSATTLRP